AVDGQKRIHGCEGRSFVAVDKRMVLGHALPQRGGFLDQVGVIAGLRPEKGGFEQAWIADAVGASITLDLVGMHGQHFSDGEIVRHLASFLYRGPYFSWLAR